MGVPSLDSMRRLNVATSESNDNSARTFFAPRRIYRYGSPRSIKSTAWPIAADSFVNSPAAGSLSHGSRVPARARPAYVIRRAASERSRSTRLVFRGGFLAVVLIAGSKYRRVSDVSRDGLDSIGRERLRSIVRRVTQHVHFFPRRSRHENWYRRISG